VHLTRSQLVVPLVALVLTASAAVGVSLLVERAGSASAQQVKIRSLELSLDDLQGAPFNADPTTGGSPTASQLRIHADETAIAAGLMPSSQAGVPSSLLASSRSTFTALKVFVTRAYGLAVEKGGLKGAVDRVLVVDRDLLTESDALSAAFGKISQTDGARASTARTDAQIGSALAMLLLLAAFAWFYVRSAAARKTVEGLARQNQTLLGASRVEARTDALTTLGNRRALTSNLAAAVAAPPGSPELLLVMFDLDGFKQYNDTFGHAAGDELLHRLGARLALAAQAHSGSAYRMGGDEFCVLAHPGPESAEKLLDDTIAALTDNGERWNIGCSHGAVWIPSEALTESAGLKLADERMYANKVGRSSPSRQITDALLQVLTEQNVAVSEPGERVSELAGALATAVGEPAYEVARIELAGRLHDIGKSAIPAAILDKPGPLSDQEWEFIHRHPAIGERIVLAAPALANTAEIIRATHERIDGRGYPDGLAGAGTPIGSRIIAVCDAFDAMTCDRPYRDAITADAALLELQRGAGTQFDSTIVDQFCKTYAARLLQRSSNGPTRSSGAEPPITGHRSPARSSTHRTPVAAPDFQSQRLTSPPG
jgi:diguanylate cyclase (GGDEF)-like protein